MVVVAVIIAAVIFYASASLVSRDWTLTGSMVLRILVVSLIAVLVIPVFRHLAGEIGAGDIGLLLAFVILVIAVRFIVVEELPVTDEWLSAIVISLIAAVLIYILDEVSEWLVGTSLLDVF
ncbi:MAG: hypothetical protein QXJ32_00490 [Thermoplasmata archaeon]